MIAPPLSTPPIVRNWLERHRHPGSFLLHVLGIPPTLLGVLTLPIGVFTVSGSVLAFSVGAFVAGYAFQFLGHLLEGSEPGEIAGLRHWLRRRRESARAVRVGPTA